MALFQWEDPRLSEDAKIWRYVDFAKFVSMLDTSSLWFARLDTFGDYFEGALSVPTSYRIASRLSRARGQSDSETLESAVDYYWSMSCLTMVSVFASCWNLCPEESVALWKIYGNEGVAIQSTIGRLKSSLVVDGRRGLELGCVRYVDDPEYDVFQSGVVTGPALTKRTIFSYEQEVRALLVDFPFVRDGEVAITELVDMFNNGAIPKGYPLRVDLGHLIEAIDVSPIRASWFSELVRSTLDRYGLSDVHVAPAASERRPVLRLNPTTIDLDRVRAAVEQHFAAQSAAAIDDTGEERSPVRTDA